MTKNKHFIGVSSYILLVVGILIALFLLGLGLFLFLAYPDASLEKKAVIAVVFVSAAFLVILLTISVFESMRELLKVEDELIHLEEEIENKQ